jgi:GNAT superfamily N-acetyltransferase
MTTDELTMVRPTLDDLPSFPLPPGFAFRWYRPGDEQDWVTLQAPFYDPGAITLDLFYEQFGRDPGTLSARQCYLLDPRGEAIGTATAWTYDGFRGPEYGRIHWVAVARDYQGQGLSKPLLGAVCRRLVELGHTRAYLTTSTQRPVAVALYRRFGFAELPPADPS